MDNYFFYPSPLYLSENPGEKNLDLYIREILKIDLPVSFNKAGSKKIIKGLHFRLKDKKEIKEISTLLVQQYYNELPVWDSGINLTYQTSDYGILSATLQNPELNAKSLTIEKNAASFEKKVTPDFITKSLDVDRNILRLKKVKTDKSNFKFKIKITSKTQLICQYKAKERQDVHSKSKSTEISNIGLFQELPNLRIPDVDKSITEGQYCHALEVLFSTTMPWGELNWRAIFDIRTGSVIYIRVLADNFGGLVYADDPSAVTGDVSILPTSPVATLNALRKAVSIPGLASMAPPLTLNGTYVTLAELTPPTNTYPSAASNFDYNVDTEAFAAVNAYVHNDHLFRLVENMGFNMSVYFNGTTFPVPVDHNGFFGCVNACAPGNGTGTGSGGFHYGVVQSGTTVGIAVCIRIVYHEFGHAVLWDNVHSPNLGFCHSVGDSLAAVLMDPRSIDPDRFLTFPWLTIANPSIDRRHDRAVAAGWGWYGANDDGGYGSEQILSTTHFRLYRSLGGDSKELCTREWASRYTAYLIFYSVGSLTPITNSPTPEHWSDTMQLSDTTTTNFEGYIGRTVHKVVRWAFEKQNAYNGLPPLVDVYINDGRNGEYQYSEDIFDSTEIWNRHKPDLGNDNQCPIVGVVNYAYVIVHNRGTVKSSSTVVYAYRTASCCCDQSIDELQWPNDFIPLKTSAQKAGSIPSNSYTVVGPFEWIPCSKDDSLVFIVSDKEDVANTLIIRPGDQVPFKKLAMFDNNIAMRRSCCLTCC